MKKKDEKNDLKKINERQRYLNVIYFVDSQKTHAFKISTTVSSIVISLMTLIILWSFISTGLLINQFSENQRQSLKIKSLLSTIFSYEAKYDQIYEKTYPSKPEKQTSNTLVQAESNEQPNENKSELKEPTLEKAAPATRVTLAAKSSTAPKTESMPSYHSVATEPKKETVTTKKKENTPALPNIPTTSKAEKTDEPKEQKAAKKPPTPPPPVEIREMNLKNYNKHVEFTFALANLDSPSLSSGYLLAIATFVDNEGNITEVLAPPGIQFMKPVDPSTLPQNHKYSIRNYAKKTLTFQKPTQFSGWVEKIRIIVKDAEGNRREIVYNPNKQS